ncbi:hypothetical protein BC567DRAFT_26943 [Phyllosticta citribraziliensis]
MRRKPVSIHTSDHQSSIDYSRRRPPAISRTRSSPGSTATTTGHQSMPYTHFLHPDVCAWSTACCTACLPAIAHTGRIRKGSQRASEPAQQSGAKTGDHVCRAAQKNAVALVSVGAFCMYSSFSGTRPHRSPHRYDWKESLVQRACVYHSRRRRRRLRKRSCSFVVRSVSIAGHRHRNSRQSRSSRASNVLEVGR